MSNFKDKFFSATRVYAVIPMVMFGALSAGFMANAIYGGDHHSSPPVEQTPGKDVAGSVAAGGAAYGLYRLRKAMAPKV